MNNDGGRLPVRKLLALDHSLAVSNVKVFLKHFAGMGGMFRIAVCLR